MPPPPPPAPPRPQITNTSDQSWKTRQIGSSASPAVVVIDKSNRPIRNAAASTQDAMHALETLIRSSHKELVSAALRGAKDYASLGFKHIQDLENGGVVSAAIAVLNSSPSSADNHRVALSSIVSATPASGSTATGPNILIKESGYVNKTSAAAAFIASMLVDHRSMSHYRLHPVLSKAVNVCGIAWKEVCLNISLNKTLHFVASASEIVEPIMSFLNLIILGVQRISTEEINTHLSKDFESLGATLWEILSPSLSVENKLHPEIRLPLRIKATQLLSKVCMRSFAFAELFMMMVAGDSSFHGILANMCMQTADCQLSVAEFFESVCSSSRNSPQLAKQIAGSQSLRSLVNLANLPSESAQPRVCAIKALKFLLEASNAMDTVSGNEVAARLLLAGAVWPLFRSTGSTDMHESNAAKQALEYLAIDSLDDFLSDWIRKKQQKEDPSQNDLLESMAKFELLSLSELSPYLKDAGNVFARECIIGEGAFGVVFRAIKTPPEGCGEHKPVVIKLFKGAHAETELRKEIRTLSHIPRHKHIANLVGFISVPESLQQQGHSAIAIVMDDGGSPLRPLLARGIEHSFSIIDDWGTKLDIALQVAKAMQFLHTLNPPILHLDLKSANVLVNMDEQGRMQAKICDFGLSVVQKARLQFLNPANAGTLAWMAPEVMDASERMDGYGPAADSYSFGVMLWELAMPGKQPSDHIPLLPGKDFSLTLKEYVLDGKRPPITEADRQTLPDGLEQLIQDCWSPDVHTRPQFSDSSENGIIARLSHVYMTYEHSLTAMDSISSENHLKNSETWQSKGVGMTSIGNISPSSNSASSNRLIPANGAIMNEVIPGIFLGNVHAARSLELLSKAKITGILNLAPRICNTNLKFYGDLSAQNFEFKSIDCEDDPNFDMRQAWEEGSQFIHKINEQGRNVLVHCFAGKSRSVSTVVFFLIAYMGKDWRKAVDLVSATHPIACINSGFSTALQAVPPCAIRDKSSE